MKIKNKYKQEVELEEYVKDVLRYHAYGGEGLGSLEEIQYEKDMLRDAFTRLLAHLSEKNYLTEKEIKKIVEG